MSDLISRQQAIDDEQKLINKEQAIDKIKKRMFETAFNNVGIKQNIDETLADVAENRLENWFDELPSAQPERPTGEWIQKPRYEDDEYPDAQPNLKCPFCGYEIGWCDMGNYCARCGADLKGGAE